MRLVSSNIVDMELSTDDLILEQLCPECFKGKTLAKVTVNPKCAVCRGHGSIPTDMGLHLIAAVMRYGKRWKDGEFKHLTQRHLTAYKNLQNHPHE